MQKKKKKGLILASLTMKPNLKQLKKCPTTGYRVYMRYQYSDMLSEEFTVTA